MNLYLVRKELNRGVNIQDIPLRVTHYSRVSTEHLEQLNSLSNQIDHFENMIKNNSSWEYIPGYVDEGITGTSDIKREKFMQMINDAKLGLFDLIITKEISRFSRNTLDSIKYTRELLSYGVAVYFVNDNINTIYNDSELRLTIMASMAQDEIRRLSERVKFGMHQAIKKGNILGNNMLYGYRKDKNTGHLIIKDDEEKIVRKIYTLYAIDNISISKIVKMLNKDNIKTVNNKKWCISTVSRMIKNPKYKGYYCANKSEIVDYMTKKVKKINESNWVIYKDIVKIPPIVTEELWQLANNKLKKIYKKELFTNRYPLSSKIICLNDNYIYHRRQNCCDEISWMCSNYLKNGKKCCATANIRENEINYIFRDILDKISFDNKKIYNILINLYKNNEKDNMIDKYQKEIDRLTIKKEKILELNIDGNLSNKEFKEYNNKCNEDILNLKKKINNIVSHEISYDNYIEEYLKQEKFYEKLMDLMLVKILVKKNKNDIDLDIYLKYVTCIKNKILTENYYFKRGYNKTSTKRYIIKYNVNCYIY